MDESLFCEMLKAFREKQGLSERQLSRLLKVPRATLYHWFKKGKLPPTERRMEVYGIIFSKENSRSEKLTRGLEAMLKEIEHPLLNVFRGQSGERKKLRENLRSNPKTNELLYTLQILLRGLMSEEARNLIIGEFPSLLKREKEKEGD